MDYIGFVYKFYGEREELYDPPALPGGVPFADALPLPIRNLKW